MEGGAFLQFLRDEKNRKYPDPPPFLAALFDGDLTEGDLHRWIKDLYHYWDNALVYSTAAIFIKINDEPLRTHVLRRLVDIEGKSTVEDLSGWNTPSYEELWLRLGEGLGVSRQEVAQWQPFTRTHFATSTLRTLSRYWDWTWLDGVATFYAADLHYGEYAGKVRDSLRDVYKVDENSLEFFRVLLDDIESHVLWEEEGLAYWACTTERQLTAARAFRERLDIENQLLVAVEQARTEDKLPLKVPA